MYEVTLLYILLMTDVATSQLPPPDTADTEDAYKAFYRIGPTEALLI